MKLLLTIALCLSALSIAQAQHPSRFDEYGNILLADEKARLNNLALELEHHPNLVGWLVVYAGRRACIGEARARAIRAKNHLVNRRGIEAQRIIWIDGGYREELTVEVWAYPRSLGAPEILATVDKSEVQIIRNCRLNHYRQQRRRIRP
jgi:hypothetical protein